MEYTALFSTEKRPFYRDSPEEENEEAEAEEEEEDEEEL